MVGSEPPGEVTDHGVVRARLGVRFNDRAGHLKVDVATPLVDVVVLEERRRRQHDIGVTCGVGHELLVDAKEQFVAFQADAHPTALWRHRGRVGVLDDHRRHRRAVTEVAAVAGQHRADA